VLSYLLLRGRCAACRAPISPRYPLVEAANGLLCLGLAAQFGPTPATVARMLLVTALVVLALIDADHQILPDVITLPGIAAGVAVSFVPGWDVGWLQALLAALGGFAVFGAVGWTWERLRGIEALGRGDWKLAAMLGAFLGWQELLLVVFLGSLAGTLVGLAGMARHGYGMRHRLPFGTFLSLAAIAVLFVGRPLIDWYGDLWRL
jgi:leader peptidase (prepilin peptidase)/N-methyltransferase